jgi:hypothetical protein
MLFVAMLLALISSVTAQDSLPPIQTFDAFTPLCRKWEFNRHPLLSSHDTLTASLAAVAEEKLKIKKKKNAAAETKNNEKGKGEFDVNNKFGLKKPRFGRKSIDDEDAEEEKYSGESSSSVAKSFAAAATSLALPSFSRKVSVTLGRDGTVRFSTGETGVWDVERRNAISFLSDIGVKYLGSRKLKGGPAATADAIRSISAAKEKNDELKKKVAMPSYQEAYFNNGITLYIELAKPDNGPVLVYSIPVARGHYQETSIRMGKGEMNFLSSPSSVKPIRVGDVDIGLATGSTMVDPAWARGRKFWWRFKRS